MSISQAQIQEYLAKGYRQKYGKLFAPQAGRPPSDLLIEFHAFRERIQGPECPGPEVHFKNIVNIIWNHPKSTKKVDWNPWAERMVYHLCRHKYLAIAGCASSGKTRIGGALWGIVNFLADPENTKVILTSTSLKDSRQRVWGEVEEYWMAACQSFGGEANMPGELVSSAGIIRYRVGETKSDRSGLTLIAGDKAKAKESIGKLIGFKQKRLILGADELPELSEALINAAESNLSANENFQMIGIGNPSSFFDPFGLLSEPKDGWNSINEESEEWETKKGYCIRFDGERSPNILAGKTLYPYMITREKLEDYRLRLGEKSLRYYRMVKGFWCPSGSIESIFSEADIVGYGANKKAIWANPPTNVAGFDPAFTNGGDRSVLYFGKYGTTVDGTKTLEWTDFIELNEDTTNKSQSRTEQIVDLLIEQCREREVSPKYLAIDGTGAGKPFCDMVRSRWCNDFLEVNFSGKASNMPASGTDKRTSDEVYVNRVSEIWFVGREYMQSGQLRGINAALGVELCSRSYKTKDRGRVQVESKLDLKKRIGKSPDCFIAGTKVLTINGLRNIEDLRKGDLVATPFGFSKVIKRHKIKVKSLSKVIFSDGSTLIGTPNHRVMTSSGWVALSKLSIDNKAVSAMGSLSWRLLDLLFTRKPNTGFKHQVDTTQKTEGRTRKRDFFIESSGQSFTGLFQKAITSITKMVIGQTTPSRIWSALKRDGINQCTSRRDGQTRSCESQCLRTCREPLNYPKSGIEAKKGSNGTASMGGRLGKTARRKLNAPASFVEKSSLPGSKEPDSVASDATRKTSTSTITKIKECVVFVAKAIRCFGFQRASLVPLVVETNSTGKPEEVFNLTLEEENAYFANGILVENCADAALLCLEVCRRRMNLNSLAQSSSSSSETGMKRTIHKMSKKLLAMRRY